MYHRYIEIISLIVQNLIQFTHPEPSVHLAHSTDYGHDYIWSSYPLPKIAKIDYSALLSFDPPSAFLFFFCLVGAVVLMKIFTYLGSKLGLETISEEPVNIPTRFGEYSLSVDYMIYYTLESKYLMLKMLKRCFLLELPSSSFS